MQAKADATLFPVILKVMAMNLCPACGEPIAMADINVQEGVGLCRSCGKLSRLKEIVEQGDAAVPVADLSPPSGCSCDEQPGGVVIVARHRDTAMTLGTLFICLFWNGIVSVFVLIAAAGVYTHLFGPLPGWFPVPRESNGNNLGPGSSWGTTLFLCIFLLPFVACGILFFVAFATSLLGRVEVFLRDQEGRVSIRVGPLSWRRKFDVARVTGVGLGKSGYQANNQCRPVIELQAGRTLKFGSLLPADRRGWMIAVLRSHLMRRPKSSRTLRQTIMRG